MTSFQSSRNFGFDTDMEMDFTEHSQKRGETLNFFEDKCALHYAIKLLTLSHREKKENDY